MDDIESFIGQEKNRGIEEGQQCPDLLSAPLLTTLTPSSKGRKSLFHLPLYGPLSGEAEVGTQAVKILGAKN